MKKQENNSYIVNFEKDHTKFILCQCKNEILVIDYDPDIELTEFAIFESYNSYNHKLSWYQKIRYCLRILLNKYPYSDQIVLNMSQVKDVINHLHFITKNSV